MAKVPLSLIDARLNRLVCQWAGPGGDALNIGHGSLWLTDYHAGTIERLALKDVLAHCRFAASASGAMTSFSAADGARHPNG
jgi:hypothetical protein